MNINNDVDSTLKQMSQDDEEMTAKAMAQALGLPYIDLKNYPIEPKILKIIPEEEAIKNRAVAFLRDQEGQVKVLTDKADNPNLRSMLEKIAEAKHENFLISFGSKKSVDFGLTLYKNVPIDRSKEDQVHVTQELQETFDEGMKSLIDLRDKISKVSTTEILDLIFAGAIKNDASDIHLEPEETDVRIRYRVDGILQDVADLPTAAFKQIIGRIKYLSKLKLDVTHPQDGRFTIDVLGEEVDIRVATLPSSFGEAVVMRLLPKKKSFITLEQLGFRPDALQAVEAAISLPQGLIFNTGPTGSGKSTTLYAILQKLNTPEKKIITMENPVEYRIEGIEQIQVDMDNETAFLDILKGSLRQDPNVMMIGEIRDAESADIALQAAMTGHLVLTTLHTNNAPSAFARLAEIGVKPYLMAGTINLIIGQRLVRKIHTECGGKGCPICHQTGYKGRVALVEYIKPTAEIEDLILRQAPIREFEEMAKKLGMKTMYQDGMEKVAAGITTKEEVERVTQE